MGIHTGRKDFQTNRIPDKGSPPENQKADTQ